MELFFLRDWFTFPVAIKLNQDVAKRCDMLVLGTVVDHRVDTNVEPELGSKDFVDATLLGDLGSPFVGRERDSAPWNDLAIIRLGSRRNGDMFVRLEARIEKLEEAAIDRLRRAGGDRWLYRRDMSFRRVTQRLTGLSVECRLDRLPRLGFAQLIGDGSFQQLGFGIGFGLTGIS